MFEGPFSAVDIRGAIPYITAIDAAVDAVDRERKTRL